MSTLTNTKIKDTYKSLLKVSDNGNLEAGLQEITDGEGNASGVQLNTGGDLTASGTVAFGSLKDSGENITIAKFVDEADGIALNDNDTSIPTSAAVKDYVDTKVTAEDLDFAGDSGTGAVDLDSQTFTIAGTANEIETSASGQTITIGLPSSVTVGTLNATTLGGTLSTAAQPNITSVGTLTGLSVNGNGTISNATNPKLEITDTTLPNTLLLQSLNGDSVIGTSTNTSLFIKTNDTTRMTVGNSGDVSVLGNLVVDTNTLYVDAANNRVGIGTSSPATEMHIKGSGEILRIEDSSAAGSPYLTFFQDGQRRSIIQHIDSGDTLSLASEYGSIRFATASDGNEQERMRIDSNGHLALGTTNTNPFGINNSNTILSTEAGAGFSGNLQIGTSGVAGDTNDYLGFLSFYSKNGGSGVEAYSRIISQLDGAINSTNLQFQTESGGVVAERMRIDSSGNVGIGGTPSGKFSISNVGGSGADFIIGQANINNYYTSGTSGFHIFRSGTAERMRIDSSGNVGIGTSSPNLKLHVAQGSGSAQIRLERTVSNAGSMILGADGDGLKIFNSSVQEKLRVLQGGGITFNGDTAAANALDDYEEGTFTPTVYGGTTAGTTTYVARGGNYTKIGRQVTLNLYVSYSALTGTGDMFIGGLPFTSSNVSQNFNIGFVYPSGLNWSGGTYLGAQLNPNSSACFVVYFTDDASVAAQQCVNEVNTMRIQLTYFTE